MKTTKLLMLFALMAALPVAAADDGGGAEEMTELCFKVNPWELPFILVYQCPVGQPSSSG